MPRDCRPRLSSLLGVLVGMEFLRGNFGMQISCDIFITLNRRIIDRANSNEVERESEKKPSNVAHSSNSSSSRMLFFSVSLHMKIVFCRNKLNLIMSRKNAWPKREREKNAISVDVTFVMWRAFATEQKRKRNVEKDNRFRRRIISQLIITRYLKLNIIYCRLGRSSSTMNDSAFVCTFAVPMS